MLAASIIRYHRRLTCVKVRFSRHVFYDFVICPSKSWLLGRSLMNFLDLLSVLRCFSYMVVYVPILSVP